MRDGSESGYCLVRGERWNDRITMAFSKRTAGQPPDIAGYFAGVVPAQDVHM